MRPQRPVVRVPSHEGRVAVGGEGDGDALRGVPHGAGADQLGALLGPDTAAPRADPRGPSGTVVAVPADDGRVAVGGEGDGCLGRRPHGAGADQLGSLLGPDAPAPRADPRGPSTTVVADALRRWPCCRRRRGTRNCPDRRLPTAPVPTSLAPCWVQTPPLRVQTHAAPAQPLSPTLRRWRCCRRRRGTRNSLARRSPRRRCRPAWLPAGSRRLRSASRPTRPQRHSSSLALRRWPCCRRRRGTRSSLVGAFPTAPVPTSLAPCWVQTPPLRVQTHAAPASPLSQRPPTMAVLPSAERETDWPCARFPRRRCRPASVPAA